MQIRGKINAKGCAKKYPRKTRGGKIYFSGGGEGITMFSDKNRAPAVDYLPN
jgi:hypothetical protein